MTLRLDFKSPRVQAKQCFEFDKILKYFLKMKRVQPSGAAKRKLTQINKDKNEREAKVHKKLTEFFVKKENDQDILALPKNDELDPKSQTSCTTETEVIKNDSEVEIQQTKGENNRSSDPAFWKSISESDIQFWLKRGPSECQNHEGPFDQSLRVFPNQTRKCTSSVFTKTLPNGERVKREHILYSVYL